MKLAPIALAATFAVVGLIAPDAAQAQRRGEITFYRDIGFRGPSQTLSGTRQTVRLGWTARSARIANGDAWQICNLPLFQGRCQTVHETQGNISWTVGSLRPTNSGIVPPPGGGGAGVSRRGMSAEFFPQPSDNRGRLESCRQGTAACTKDSANRFCRTRGWNASSFERQETVGGRNYLADVLCTRTG